MAANVNPFLSEGKRGREREELKQGMHDSKTQSGQNKKIRKKRG